ncbi:MAG: aromatic aminobenezylarsenical efflux permease ArsG family transporter [Elusimicrobiota bacterium]
MSGEFLMALLSALWTGVLTSISPCPLATNIAALTYIAKHSGSQKAAVLIHGLFYALGRSLAYIVIGFLLVKSLLSASAFSFFMQKYGGQALSPILILAGMYMLEMFGRGFEGFNILNISNFKARSGWFPSLLMGGTFAMAFCPVSAALYFGVIVPLAAANAAPFSLPLFYGLGTALPVIAISLALDLGFKKISAITGLAGKLEKFARPATGWIFIVAGIYLALRDIFSII